jgi:hypothetical protein
MGNQERRCLGLENVEVADSGRTQGTSTQVSRVTSSPVEIVAEAEEEAHNTPGVGPSPDSIHGF